MPAKNISIFAAWGFIAAIIIGCVIMGWVIWPQAEDINAYGNNPELLLPFGEPTPPFSELERNAIDSYLHHNGRLVNYNNILLTSICPKWSWTIINLIPLTLIFLLLWKIANFGKEKNNGKSVCVAFMGILALMMIPWNDYLFLQCYTTPYIWGGAMMLFIAYECLKNATGRPLKKLTMILLFLVAIICGGWHEGLSITLICGIMMLWFMTPKSERRLTATVFICLIAGLLFNLTSPGHSNRVETVGVHLNPVNWFQPATLTEGVWLWPHIVPMLIYLTVIFVILLVNRKDVILFFKEIASNGWIYGAASLPDLIKVQVLATTITASTLGICLFFNVPRVAVPGLLLSIVGLLSLFICYYSKETNRRIRRIAKVAVSLCSIIFLANIGVNIAMQLRLSRDHQTIERMLAESPDGQVFYDPIEWPHQSHYPWQWTINHYYVNYVPLHFILIHPSNKRHLPLRLIPTALKNLPATISVKGITFVDGNIISDSEPTYTSSDDNRRELIFPEEYPFLKINAVVETASGREEIRFFEIIPFTTGKGSSNERDLYYFRPVWRSHAEITDPAVKILSISPAKYW